MRTNQLAVAVLVCLSCTLLAAACVQSPTASLETDATDSGPDLDAEPTGEAEQAAYEDVFHFVVIIKDPGDGDAGGWQEANANLKFSDWRKPFAPYFWKCPIKVGMPLRTQLRGRISAEYAAKHTARVTTMVTESLMHSRDWRGLGELYCRELYDQMRRSLNSPQPIGARVSRP